MSSCTMLLKAMATAGKVAAWPRRALASEGGQAGLRVDSVTFREAKKRRQD